ncbi:MAG: hypothetical protein CME26_06435 [Gemmatimonadetes bacterium]|nr:hypothetical protein [Gemmatimonadota bacterium]|tara:strand:+ start:758 stop:1603 length:846 start_codon:yes stop_codon:yes gene_type:complete
MYLEVSTEEKRAGRMSDENVARAVKAVRMEGYVVVEGIIDPDHLDVLKARMDEDVERKIQCYQNVPSNFDIKGHIQHKPPPFAPYVFEDVVANGFISQITHVLLGDGLFNHFYSGNTNCPGSGTQPLHPDGQMLWPELERPHPVYSLVINISPEDTSDENGAVELWPGTHLLLSEPDNKKSGECFPEPLIAKRREEEPPIRGEVKKGGALIRDVRLWHRGMPNPSDSPRHMIALIHAIRWYHNMGPLKFETGCEEAFPESVLDHNVEFVDELLDYMNHPKP